MCSVSGAECRVLPNGSIPQDKARLPFYRHKEGRCTCTGDRRSRRLLPESRGCSGQLWKVHCGVWRLAWQSSWASSLALRRSRRRPCSSSGRRGRCCRGYRPPDVAWRRSEGPAGQGPIPVKIGAASEGRAHAVQWLHGGESMKEVWGVGSTVAGAVPGPSCTASQVPQCRHSVRNGGAVTGVGGRDSGHSHCAEWLPDAVRPGCCGGVVGI